MFYKKWTVSYPILERISPDYFTSVTVVIDRKRGERNLASTVNMNFFFSIHYLLVWGTVAHWLEHWTHDHKVVGTSPDSSSLCWVPEQDS